MTIETMWWMPEVGELVEWYEHNGLLNRQRKLGMIIRRLTIFDIEPEELHKYRGSMLYDVMSGDDIHRIDRYTIRKLDESDYAV